MNDPETKMMDAVESDAIIPTGALALRDGQIHTTMDLRVYRLSAIQKAAYRLASRCTVVLGEIHGDTIPVTVLLAPSADEGDAFAVARLFFQEALDQELREKVGEETAPLRTLILAHAFSKTKLAPPG